MASLSNINGIFDVHSTGAILFSTSHGTSGQILRSNGNAAPTWVAASTVIGGPYLPLTGGTLTGATATASGISFTVGGDLTVGDATATNQGLRIESGNGTGDYGVVRFKHGGTNRNTIHAFSQYWQSGTIYTAATDSLNFDGHAGVTIGPWNNIDVAFVQGGASYFKNDVGIGTASPNQSNLVVSPSAQSADVDGITVVYNPDGATNRVRGQLKIDSFNGILELTNSADTISTYITAAGDSYFTGGNVGIGTTSPSATEPTGGNLPTGWARAGSRALEIAAPDFANSGLFLRNSDTTATGTDITGDQYFGDTYIDNRYNNDNGSIYFRTKTAATAVYAMAIKGTGNVGIGTSSPAAAAKLTIMGNQTFGLPGNGTNTSGRFISIEGNTDGSGEGSSRIFFTEHNSTTGLMDNYGMSLGYRGGATSIVGASGNTWTGLTQIGNGQWGMWGHNNSATGSLVMFGDRAATYISIPGNVGIGTTSTSQKLDVAGNIRIRGTNQGILLDTTGADQAARVLVENDYELAVFTNRGSAGFGVFGNSNIRLGFGTSHTSTQTSLFINSSGNVGIGRTAPDYKLVISNGNAEGIELGPGYASGNNLWQNYNRTTGAYVKETHYASTYAFLTAGGNTGNVGIGTSSPKAKLDVDGDVNTTGYNSNTLEFSTFFTSGSNQVIATLSSPAAGTTCVATIEYVALYNYGGTNIAAGIIMASTRYVASVGNTYQQVDDITVSLSGNDTNLEPTLFWVDGINNENKLKINVGSSVQVTARVRITYHDATLTRNYAA